MMSCWHQPANLGPCARCGGKSAQQCPVCKTRGYIKTATKGAIDCPQCHGKGWLS